MLHRNHTNLHAPALKALHSGGPGPAGLLHKTFCKQWQVQWGVALSLVETLRCLLGMLTHLQYGTQSLTVIQHIKVNPAGLPWHGAGASP